MNKPKFFNKKCFDFDLFSCDKKVRKIWNVHPDVAQDLKIIFQINQKSS